MYKYSQEHNGGKFFHQPIFQYIIQFSFRKLIIKPEEKMQFFISTKHSVDDDIVSLNLQFEILR